MPIKGERTRKIRAIRAGRGVRPPKGWFDMMRPVIRKEYPGKTPKKINKIIGGIWQNYSTPSKIEIVKGFQK